MSNFLGAVLSRLGFVFEPREEADPLIPTICRIFNRSIMTRINHWFWIKKNKPVKIDTVPY